MIFEKAKIDDSSAIIDFIAAEWKKDHFFVKDPRFFRYHYTAPNSSNGPWLNMYLAKEQNGEILGLLGYLPTDGCSGQSETHLKPKVIFLSLWFVKKNGNPSVGFRLLTHLIADLNPVELYCSGINPETKIFYRRLGYFCSTMNRNIFINQHFQGEHSIIEIPYGANQLAQIPLNKLQTKIDRTLKILNKETIKTHISNLTSQVNSPKKTVDYIYWRYVRHPIYEYTFISLNKKNDELTLVVRELSFKDAKSLRLVDILGNTKNIGNLAGDIKEALLFLLLKNNYEYVELTCAGLKTCTIENMGFSNVDSLPDDFVMPGYFEPFVRTNPEISFFSSKTDNFLLMLGDGDQDRPNL